MKAEKRQVVRRWRRVRPAALGCGLVALLGAQALFAEGASGAAWWAANVGPGGFDLFVRTADADAEPALAVFLDAEGSLPAELRIERQPLRSGSTGGDPYARRLADRALRAALGLSGNHLFRIEGAAAGTDYHPRVTSAGVPVPAAGALPVRTTAHGGWVATSQQVLVDLDRAGAGWIALLDVPGAVAPLLAVCGDGTASDATLHFNLGDALDAAGMPVGIASDATLGLRLFGALGSAPAARDIAYSPPPADAMAVAALHDELAPLLSLLVGSAVHATAQPGAGEHLLFEGSTVTCRLDQSVVVQDGTQYVAFGWSGTGSVPAGGRGAEFSFALTADSSMDWSWRTNYWVEVLAEQGSVDLPSGWYRSGSALQATATADAEWTFAGWSGLASGVEPSTALTLAAPGELVASFDPVLVPGGFGMPEWWLTRAGLAGADRALHADPDRDGATNLQEWIADTDPADPLSRFRITTLARAGAQFNLTWQGGREARQIVESSPSLEGPWTPVIVREPPTAVVGVGTVEVGGGERLFFRLRAQR